MSKTAARRASCPQPCCRVRRLRCRPGPSGNLATYPHPKHPISPIPTTTTLTEPPLRPSSIYKPSKPATQSGTQIGTRWRIDWDVLGKGHRWENPLMGWQSSGDAVQGTHIHFKTKEDAIAFAEKQGYEYFVQEPNTRKITPKAYANNFLYSPGKLKHIRTK